ncbi:MAG: OmpA family protein [Bernardetiaceae bacterium]|nr:OmpA family protein [Bernardetiaceae bacterium]
MSLLTLPGPASGPVTKWPRLALAGALAGCWLAGAQAQPGGAAQEAQAQPEAQWAARVIAVSSEYSTLTGASFGQQYRAVQVLGPPNKLPAAGSSPCAWAPARDDNRFEEWIKVGYDRPMQISQVAIAENLNPGAVSHVYAYDEADNEHLIYKNLDTRPVDVPARMLNLTVQLTPFKVAAVKVILATADVPGRNQLDAIGISGTERPVMARINLPSNLETSELTVDRLGAAINSPADEIVPVVSPDGRTIYFDRKNHPRNIPNPDDPFNDDIWVSEQDSTGAWQPARNLGPPLNNQSHNFVCSVTPDGNTLLLANKYLPEGKSIGGLSLSQRLGPHQWAFPQEVKVKNYYNLNKYSEFFLGSNQRVLLLAIEREDTQGSRDLYVSFIQPNNEWSEPKHLGPDLNSAATEMTPFLAPDQRTLYFATDGRSGYGETDMFVTRRLDDTWTRWSEPVNLGPQLNSRDWDASYTLDAKGENAYFVSYNNATAKSADIFRAKLPKAVRPEAVVLIKGRVYNAQTNQPIAAEVIYETLPQGQTAGTATASPGNGNYQIVLPYQNTYGILAKAPGYMAVHEHIDLKQTGQYQEIERNLYLVPLQVGQNVRLNNVFFTQGTDELLPASAPELNRVVELLQDNPGLEIELEGHTDIDGPAHLNMKLAQERVKAIRQYLVDRGVMGRRISTQAYGPKRPITRKRDEASKQLNRRVEFKVINF